jgi:cysteinyl-tRNA synthetase
MAVTQLHRLASAGKFSKLLASAQLMGLLSFCAKKIPIGLDKQFKIRIEGLLKERREAKKEKDFVLADSIRDKIIDAGVLIKDTSSGTEWEIDSSCNFEKLKAL